MTLDQICGWTIQDWQHAYKTKEIKIEDLIQIIQQLNLEDTAWISIASDEQIQAQIQDIKNSDIDDSENIYTHFPLYGIPFAVKDNIDVEGFVSTAACRALKEVALEDATVVRALKKAGAIVVGKTNLDQFATGLVGTRSPYGAVSNTFKKDYVSGGSSSGSASVVARGIVPFALGTDTAGSGRVPAGFNNIVGLKPTKGRFSNFGLLPACKTIDCISIFALTVQDAAYVADFMEAYDIKDSYSRENPNTAPASFSSNLTFAIPRVLEFFGDQYAEEAFSTSIETLKALGVSIVEIDFSPFEKLAKQLYQGAWVAERTTAVEHILENYKHDFDAVVLEIVEKGYDYTAVDAYKAEYLKQDLTRQIQEILATVDALCVPTSPTIYTIEQMKNNPIKLNAQFGTYTNFTNLADLSALALPSHFREDGLPFGITCIAPAWYDTALADFGIRWQNHLALQLGATSKSYDVIAKDLPLSKHHIRVAVVGAHLTGMPLNFQLTSRQAVRREVTKTASNYSLYALNGTVPPKPGLARGIEGGSSIVVELWDIPMARFGEFVAEVPTPLGIGNVELEDGRWIKGFICEPYGLENAENITQFGGWRAYIQHINSSHQA